MAFERRVFAGAAVATTLTGNINSSATTFAIAATTNWPTTGDFFVVIAPGTAAEEKVRCASRSGSTVTVQTSGRGADGTSAASHSSGDAVYLVGTAVDFDEANNTVHQTIGSITAKGDLLAGSAANTLTKLAAGTNGLALVTDSTQTTGLKYAAPAPAAHETTHLQNGSDPLATGTPTTSAVGDAAAQGTANGYALSDHTHGREAFSGSTPAATTATGTVGSAATLSHSDHAHAIGSGSVDGSTIQVSSGVLSVKTITTAQLATGLPQGYITGATVTTNQTGVGTDPTDLTGLTITFTGDGVKRARIAGKVTFICTGGAGQAQLYLKEGSTVLDTFFFPTNSSTDEFSIVFDYDFVPSAASHTYKLASGKNAFDMDLKASSTNRARIYAEWIG